MDISASPEGRIENNPGLQPISAKITVIARRLIVPEGLHDASLPRKLSGLEWCKKKRSVPEGQDDCVGVAVDSIAELNTCQHDLCRLRANT
jgi:hypothetical protein